MHFGPQTDFEHAVDDAIIGARVFHNNFDRGEGGGDVARDAVKGKEVAIGVEEVADVGEGDATELFEGAGHREVGGAEAFGLACGDGGGDVGLAGEVVAGAALKADASGGGGDVEIDEELLDEGGFAGGEGGEAASGWRHEMVDI